MVCPSGAKRAERMLPRRKVSWRYVGGVSGAAENICFPAYSPTANATSTQVASNGHMKLRRVSAWGTAFAGTLETGADSSVISPVRDESMDRLMRFKSARISAD